MDWDYLKSQNGDVVAWIYSPGVFTYPVVQTTDNDFYLHRGFDRQPNTSGTLFADPSSTVGVTFSNFIIYGHNMKDGSMLAAAEKYMDQSFYEQHPSMWFVTPYGDYKVELIAGHITESSLNNYPGYFDGDSDYMNYMNKVTSHSTFSTHAELSTEYQLITMSTCDYSSNFRDPRYLLQGLMIPVGEESPADNTDNVG